DRRFDGRLLRVLVDHEVTGRDREAAADLGHHEVAGAERNVGVALVECVRSRNRDVADGLRRCGGHGCSSRRFVEWTDTTWLLLTQRTGQCLRAQEDSRTR